MYTENWMIILQNLQSLMEWIFFATTSMRLKSVKNNFMPSNITAKKKKKTNTSRTLT